MNPPQPPKGQGPSKGQGGKLPNWSPPRVPQPPQKPQKKAPAKAAPPAPQKPAKKGPEMSHFACPSCLRPFSFPAKFAGRKSRCPCGARLVLPPPGGVPRALSMPGEQQRKAAEQAWRASGDKNATEIALETSPAKVAAIVGVLIAAVIGFVIWRRQDSASVPQEETRPAEETGAGDVPGEMTAPEIATKCGPSVVTVEALDENSVVLGSGCGFVVADRCVATSFNIILGAASVRLRTAGGDTMPASAVAAIDAAADIVLLQFDSAEPAALPAAETPLEPGSRVFVLGPKSAFGNDIREGKVGKGPAGSTLLAVPTAVTAENAGGPVLNGKGQVVGIAVLLPGNTGGAASGALLKKLIDARATRPLAEVIAAAAQRPGPEILTDARRLLDRGRASTAVVLLERACARETAGPDLLVALGDALLECGRPRAAGRRFEMALREKAGWPARSGLGQAILEAGHPAAALPHLRAAAGSGAESDGTTLAALALALARLGDPEAAANAAGKAMEVTRPGLRANYLAALAFATAKKADGQKRAIDAIVKLRPAERTLLCMRGEIALAAEEHGAKDLFDEARQAGAGARALIGRGKAQQALGAAEAARATFLEAEAGHPPEEEAYFALARATEAAGEHDRAMDVYRDFLAIDPADPEASGALGRLLFATAPAKAIPLFELEAKARPDAADPVVWLSRARVATGDIPGAMKDLSDFLVRHPGDADVRVELATLKADGSAEETLKLLEGLQATGTLAARAAYARGTALLDLDRAPEARQAFDLAVSYDPSSGLYRYQRAIAAEGENIHEARALWEGYLVWAKKAVDDPERVARVVARLREKFGR